MGVIAEGVNAHVPVEDRHVDARTLLPTFGITQSLRGKRPDVPPAFTGVPLKEKLVAGARVLLSQTPFHDPAHEPLPEFAGRWFERYDGGGDVVHWYGS